MNDLGMPGPVIAREPEDKLGGNHYEQAALRGVEQIAPNSLMNLINIAVNVAFSGIMTTDLTAV